MRGANIRSAVRAIEGGAAGSEERMDPRFGRNKRESDYMKIGQ